MPKDHMNGPIKINHNNVESNTKTKNSKSKNGTLNTKARSTKNKFQSYEDDDLDLAPYVVRKDRLIQELETSLAEMDGQLQSASKLEEQRTAVEDQRTVLLKEIETAVSDIQGHVLNAREMEIEKKAIENECNSLKEQVKHLRTLLDDKKPSPNDKQWNYIDLSHTEDAMRVSLTHANSRNQALEKEIKKLRLANERLHLKEKSSKRSGDFEQLQRDYLDLQKLLQVAETSEDNIAHELATCHQTMAQMKDDYEQLEKVKNIIEEERDGLVLLRAEMEMELQKFPALEEERDSLALEKTELEREIKTIREDKQNCNVIEKDSSSSRSQREKEALQKKLEKYEEQCEKVEQENSSYKQQVEQLQNELKTLREETTKTQTEKTEDSTAGNKPLKAAIVKLNKENSELQVNLEKAEKEIEELKSQLSKVDTGKEDKSHQLRPAFEKLNKENSELQIKLEKTEQELSAIKICLEEDREGKKLDEPKEAKKAEKTKKKVLKLKDSKKSKKDKKELDDSDGTKDELELLKKEKFDLTSECQALAETVTKIAGEKRRMDKDIQELNNEKTKLQGKITELETTIKELEVIKEKKEELEAKNQETELCLAQVSAELEKTVESKTSLNEKFAKVTGEKEALVSEQKEFQESLEAIKQEMENVRIDVSNKSTEIKVLRKKHEEEKRRLIGMKDGGDKEINRIKTELRDISAKVMKVTDEDAEHDSDNVISTVEKLHQDLEKLSQTNSELKQSKEELESKLKEVSQQAEELQKENAKASDMAMEKAVELSRTKRSLERKIEKLSKENAEYRSRLGVATPAMSITPRMSPETVQVKTVEVAESQPPQHSLLAPLAPPRQRPPSQNSRVAEARYEGSSKPVPSGIRPMDYPNRGPQEHHREGPRPRPSGTRDEGDQDYPNRGPQEHYREGPRPRPGPPGTRNEGDQDHPNRGPQEHYREGPRPRPSGTRNEGADSRPLERSPPPYPLTKRKSLDNELIQDKDRGSRRDLPSYPPRERRISETRQRPPSASVNREDEARGGNSLAKERRRSDGGYTYHKRISNEGERYRHDQRPSDQKSAFRVVNYRKRVVHEDYV